MNATTKHRAHNGFPLSLRAAGSRTVPQREQDTALALAVQLRQIRWPSHVLLKVTTRPQRGQAGRWMWQAPASQSASIGLSTKGNGAFTPVPVSSSGLSSTAHASFCS
jgi:hypothetical protein